jgi:hypothetical protein
MEKKAKHLITERKINLLIIISSIEYILMVVGIFFDYYFISFLLFFFLMVSTIILGRLTNKWRIQYVEHIDSTKYNSGMSNRDENYNEKKVN